MDFIKNCVCVCVGNELYIMLTLDMGYSYGGGISSLYILSTVLHTEMQVPLQ